VHAAQACLIGARDALLGLRQQLMNDPARLFVSDRSDRRCKLLMQRPVLIENAASQGDSGLGMSLEAD
jgi:hypothetical protein